MALHQRSGTRVTADTIGDVTNDAAPPSDPLLVVTEDLLHRREYPHGTGSDATAASGDDYVTLAFRAGSTVRRSTLLAMLTPATVDEMTPASGISAGGDSITLTGSGLDGVTGVTIGGAEATEVTVVDPRTVTLVTPAGTAGPQDVVVTDDAGSVPGPYSFLYIN